MFDRGDRPIFIRQKGNKGILCFVAIGLHLGFVLKKDEVVKVDSNISHCDKKNKTHGTGTLIFGDNPLVEKVIAKYMEMQEK
jgi:hypothetical protein